MSCFFTDMRIPPPNLGNTAGDLDEGCELLCRAQTAAKGPPTADRQSGQSIAKAAPDLQYTGKIQWDGDSATLTFLTSGTMPEDREGFFWKIRPHVKRIQIAANVRVQGGFRVLFREPNNPLVIEGADRKTSIIYGTDKSAWTTSAGIAESDKWRYGAINVIEDATVHVRNLTSKNPRGYNVSGYANKAVIHVDQCDLIDDREGDNNNSDGFLGSAGSSIRNSLISTSDDGIKVYHDITIENVIIEQHRNGAPLQFGWWDENDAVTATIGNLTIRGVQADGHYNMAPFTWENGQHGKRNVLIDGLDVDVPGQLYDEATGTWLPMGLVELKPVGCEFRLEAKNARLRELGAGVRKTPGRITVNDRSF